jgi:hypothetical protein
MPLRRLRLPSSFCGSAAPQGRPPGTPRGLPARGRQGSESPAQACSSTVAVADGRRALRSAVQTVLHGPAASNMLESQSALFNL